MTRVGLALDSLSRSEFKKPYKNFKIRTRYRQCVGVWRTTILTETSNFLLFGKQEEADDVEDTGEVNTSDSSSSSSS